jgi:seryl-tRNA synthetase
MAKTIFRGYKMVLTGMAIFKKLYCSTYTQRMDDMPTDKNTVEYYEAHDYAKRTLMEKRDRLITLANELKKAQEDKRKLDTELDQNRQREPCKPHALSLDDTKDFDKYVNDGKEYVRWCQERDRKLKDSNDKIKNLVLQIHKIIPEEFYGITIELEKKSGKPPLKIQANRNGEVVLQD